MRARPWTHAGSEAMGDTEADTHPTGGLGVCELTVGSPRRLAHRVTVRAASGLRRAWLLTLLVGGVLGVIIAPSAVAHPGGEYANEAQFMATHQPHRMFFIADPGVDRRFSHAQLASGALFQFFTSGPAEARFDRNFMIWAPIKQIDVGNRSWADCPSGDNPTGQICPGPYRYREVEHTVLDGIITAKTWGTGFIATACANFSQGGTRSGPIPRIRGVKYLDRDADGARDPGEPGLADWTIRLRYEGSVVATTTTDASGNYEFRLDAQANPALGAGTYKVEEVLKAGWSQGEAPGSFTVPPGVGDKVFSGKDFGNWRPVTISGRKFEDLNADSSGAGDPGIEGWQISISGRASANTSTDAAGTYTFSGLRPGRYLVTEQARNGWNQSAPASGAYTVDLQSGESARDRDFGNWRPVSIVGRKFHDDNVDGLSNGDPGLGDWEISIDGGTSQTTGADGGYRFDGLRPGTYTLRESLRPGWRQSAPPEGTHTVTLRSGDSSDALEFGNVCLGSTAITVRDLAGGDPLTGLEMRLEEIEVPGILDNDPSLPRTSTGGSFADLLPGRYRVIVFLDEDMFSADSDTQVIDGRWATVKEITVNQCSETELDIEIFRASNGRVTGGMKMNVDGAFATAGFQFQTSPQGEPRGTLEYQDQGRGLNLHTDQIQAIYVSDDGREAWIWGLVDYEGDQARFRLHLVDEGEPGTLDRFELDVLDRYTAGHDENIIGGNVQMHPDS